MAPFPVFRVPFPKPTHYRGESSYVQVTHSVLGSTLYSTVNIIFTDPNDEKRRPWFVPRKWFNDSIVSEYVAHFSLRPVSVHLTVSDVNHRNWPSLPSVDLFRWRWLCSFRDVISLYVTNLDQGTVTIHHSVQNWAGNTLVNVICRYDWYFRDISL